MLSKKYVLLGDNSLSTNVYCKNNIFKFNEQKKELSRAL